MASFREIGKLVLELKLLNVVKVKFKFQVWPFGSIKEFEIISLLQLVLYHLPLSHLRKKSFLHVTKFELIATRQK